MLQVAKLLKPKIVCNAESSITEVIMESEDQKNEIWMSEEHTSRHSQDSGTSAKSFAFPV